MIQRVMCDLFCGTRFGWTKGFVAHGWKCKGIDMVPVPDYPGEFIQADIAQLLELPPADFYCCSSPCEQFSVHGMKHFHPNPKWPWLGIALFEHARQMLQATGKPYVMENVRTAQGFIGMAANRVGPFYFWGSGTPALMPIVKLTKGFGKMRHGSICMGPLRKSRSSLTAEIPLPLASHIAQMAVNL